MENPTEKLLADLEAAVERTGGRRERYVSASKEDCLSACTNMVLLMTGRNPAEARRQAPSAKEEAGDVEALSTISTWFADRAAFIKDRVGSRIADKVYEACLLDCVDDYDKSFPKQLAQCWIKAKTDEDEEACNQLAAAWRVRAAAEVEVERLKQEISTIEKLSGRQTWSEFLGFDKKDGSK